MIYTQHEAGKIFPRLSNEGQVSLRDSISKFGLLNPIWIYEGKILSGYERYIACLNLNLKPTFRDFTNTVISAAEFVWAENAERKHLTKGQLAAAALVYKDLISEEVNKKRYERIAETKKLGIGIQPKDFSRTSASIAGAKFGVAREAVIKANKISKEDPKTFKLLKEGKITLNAAYDKVSPGFLAMRKSHRGHAGRGHNQGHVDARARKIMAEEALKNFVIPSNIYASDQDILTFDKLLESKGYNLVLTRIGGVWDAKYSKNKERAGLGHSTYKAAILGAGKEALAKEANEKKNQMTLC
jgi:hypothetical protein